MSNDECTPEMNMTPPESPAGRDVILWDKYVNECEADGTRASLSGYLIWLDDNDVEDKV